MMIILQQPECYFQFQRYGQSLRSFCVIFFFLLQYSYCLNLNRMSKNYHLPNHWYYCSDNCINFIEYFFFV